MAIDNLLTSDESRLSGAYIRTLVKQLTTSKPTNSDNNILLNNDNILVGAEYTQSTIACNKGESKLGMAKPKVQNAQGGHKKQVRRRLHTSRPYQERLLNMAEARKEIVTALKFHRASMKQASEKKQHQHQHQHQHPTLGPPKIESFPYTNTNTNTLVDNLAYYPSYDNLNNYNNNNNTKYSNNDNNNNNYYSNNNNCYNTWMNTSIPLIEPPIQELPNQTLGLNLNLQAFTNIDTTFCQNNNNNKPITTMSSPSSSSSSTPRDHHHHRHVVSTSVQGVGGHDMHHSLDEGEMAKMRWIGEQHQMELDDTLELVKSAWWFKFVNSNKGVEIGNNKDVKCEDEYTFEEFPTWLGDNNDQCFLQQHLEESCSSEGYSLPWVDIGEIDGMDDEWLS